MLTRLRRSTQDVANEQTHPTFKLPEKKKKSHGKEHKLQIQNLSQTSNPCYDLPRLAKASSDVVKFTKGVGSAFFLPPASRERFSSVNRRDKSNIEEFTTPFTATSSFFKKPSSTFGFLS